VRLDQQRASVRLLRPNSHASVYSRLGPFRSLTVSPAAQPQGASEVRSSAFMARSSASITI
jgi:hypothetical protein